jgi:tetratricopeptide (TPR) repeat protein
MTPEPPRLRILGTPRQGRVRRWRCDVLGPSFVTACVLFSLFARAASAEEWYDAYVQGIKALERHQTEKAILSLERAARLRPEPGTNIITYGTNWLGEYAPYLSLAEAYLLAGKPEQAREALRRSETFLKEAADRRARLAANVEAAVQKTRAATTPAGPAPGAASAPAPPSGWGREAELKLLLARSHLLEAQAALAQAVERDRNLAPLVDPLSPQLAGAVRDVDKALEGRGTRDP